jgi:hypothetical protein
MTTPFGRPSCRSCRRARRDRPQSRSRARRARRVLESHVLGTAEQDDPLERTRIGGGLADRRLPSGIDEGPARAAVGEDERELPRMQLRIDRHDDETRPPAAEHRFHIFGRIGRNERDALAGAKSSGSQCAGDARGASG